MEEMDADLDHTRLDFSLQPVYMYVYGNGLEGLQVMYTSLYAKFINLWIWNMCETVHNA